MKHVKLFEDFLNEGNIKFNDLVGNKFTIEVGSGTKEGTWDSDSLENEIEEALSHYLFDWDFYYNWTEEGEEYQSVFKKDTLDPMLKKMDKTLSDMFEFKADKLTFKLADKSKKMRDDWFKTNKSISNQLRQDYYQYREKYAGVKL